MDLNFIKENLASRRESEQYRLGVRDFMRYATSDLSSSSGKIYCPCGKCVNNKLLSPDEVNLHLLSSGMMCNYSTWIFHGEQLEDTSVDEPMVTNPPLTHMQQLVHDAYGQRNEESGFNDSPPVINMSTNKWSNKSISKLLEILRLAIPNGEHLPKSFAEAKKVISKLGLDYIKIDACPKHCQLYWKEKIGDDTCSTCGTSRWKRVREQLTSTGRKKKKGIPANVLRYFPLKPRLKRLFMSKKTASYMRWHSEGRTKEDKVLRHPADSNAWQDFDSRYPNFGAESRNVRLGLASDGFNPFGMLSSTYSCWPVVLVPYNLPPWMCLKASSLILSTLIPGPSSPGNKIDVYLQPLIEELIELWDEGIETYDASKDETFTLHAGLLWTISDFPGYGMLSGWGVHGEKACPCCNSQTDSKWLYNSHKFCYMGSRRLLEENHDFRYNKEAFNGSEEHEVAPTTPSGAEVLRQIEDIQDFSGSKTWKKKSEFFKLPYWDSHLIRHNLDVMHIEKNVCDNVIGTLLNLEGKSKDNLKARRDLEVMGIRKELHPQERGSRYYLPPAPYTMSRVEKHAFCKLLHELKVPNGYAGNISREHVIKLEASKGPECLNEELRMLARGPLDVITKYQGYNVNGFSFRAKRYDKCTQNSGVVVVAKTSSYASASDRRPVLGDVTYYGRIIEIIELKYLGGYSTIMFKWRNPTDEPYIFATQAEQVFYIQDQVNEEWSVALKMKPKHVNDIGDDGLSEDEEIEPYHVSFLNLYSNTHENPSWVRLGVEGTLVDD
ncbi:uncharacterized protein LOC141627797 [Silene latifolia]|uniref:uncharacterized protein LOC141627797 n=1 Tax=Silene latifolia TaxID=37657 RepID=UPI003D784EB4